jgi:hypothetical protein
MAVERRCLGGLAVDEGPIGPATLALLGVIADIVMAYADAAKLEQHAAAIAADIGKEDFAKTQQDFTALCGNEQSDIRRTALGTSEKSR